MLVFLATLMHETYVAYTVVPLLHAVVVRRTRPAVARALAFLAIVPVYALLRAVQGRAFGAASSWLGVILEGARLTPDKLVEHPPRVLFAVLTGGLPFDPLRALPWFGEFARIREMMLGPVGIATLVVVLAPTLGLAALALTATRRDVVARRRTVFYVIWLAAGSLPLMLPVGTPEAVHLVGALPALFLLWSEAFVSDAGRAALASAWLLLAAWTGVHLGARFVLVYRDLPAVGRAVRALHGALREAQASGTRAAVVFVPAHIGAHYGMLPTVPALYRDGAGGCVRGERPAGCLVEPVWVWSTLRPAPRLPPVCRTADGVRLGPIDAAAERELEGTRRMLAHPAAGFGKPGPEALMGACPLRGVAEEGSDGARYRLYRVQRVDDVRWYRFSLDGPRALEPVGECGGR